VEHGARAAPAAGRESPTLPGWVTPALWILLALLLVTLISVAGFLLVKMDLFSSQDLTDEEIKSVWAFLGVALGAVVTLIGTLLTEQNNRRTAALTAAAAEREQRAREAQHVLDTQAEKRLSLDTVTKLLELITDEGDYAKPARVGGAIATMVELEGGTVALRILSGLWAADAVDTSTAVWLLDRVLTETRPHDEQSDAAFLLAMNAAKLVPRAGDAEQDGNDWPTILDDAWPSHLNSSAKSSLLLTAVRVLLARDLRYWMDNGGNYPVQVFYWALADDDYQAQAAYVLRALSDSGALAQLNAVPADEQLAEIRTLASSFLPARWYERLVSQFEPWARHQSVHAAGALVAGEAGTAQSPPDAEPSH
jgi:hypothetical protein